MRRFRPNRSGCDYRRQESQVLDCGKAIALMSVFVMTMIDGRDRKVLIIFRSTPNDIINQVDRNSPVDVYY